MASLAEDRAHWPSKWIFILAAIGSAAGLGNLWRFPFLAYDHGGAAFVLVLILANIIVGIPLLMLEVGIGQKTQRGAPDAFGHIKKSFRYLGWLAISLGFIVMAYYLAVVSWGINYLGSSFTLAWGDDTEGFFFNSVLNLSDGPGAVGGLSWPVLAGLILGWIVIYFIVWKGVRSISKVVVWTATLPFLILAILIVRAVTLPGAGDGLALYLIPQWQALADPQLWLAAFSQTFFSFSLAFGVMVAYGSFNKENTDVVTSSLWIAGGNLLVSIMAGFVVFGTLGYMAGQEGVGVSEIVAGGPSLAFVAFPQAISLLPAFNALIAVLFFGTLLLLAVDSAFSLVEAVVTPFKDRYPQTSSKKITFLACLVGGVAGIAFTTYAGLYYLDIVDHFVVNYGLVIVGLLEAILIGWFWKMDELRDFINKHAKWKLNKSWNFAIRYLTPLFLIVLLIWNLVEEFRAPYGDYPGWALFSIGILPILLAPIAAYALDRLAGKKAPEKY